jgi:hypothetical protein
MLAASGIHRMDIAQTFALQPLHNFPGTYDFGTCSFCYGNRIEDMVLVAMRNQNKVRLNFIDIYPALGKFISADKGVKQQFPPFDFQ